MDRDDPISHLGSAPSAPPITTAEVDALQDWARALPRDDARASLVRAYLSGVSAGLLGAPRQHVRESCNILIS